MLEYIKYFGSWLFFMSLIAVITLAVPKIAKAMEKRIAQIKDQTKGKHGIADLSDEAIMPDVMPADGENATETTAETEEETKQNN